MSITVRAIAQIARMKDVRNSRKHIQRAHVNAAIDERRNIRARLLHIMIDCTRLRINYQTTIVNGLLFGRFRTHYRYLKRAEIDKKRISIDKIELFAHLGLSIFRSMKFVQILQGEIRANVTVQYKKCRRIAGTDLITEMIHAAGCAEHRKFLQISDSPK